MDGWGEGAVTPCAFDMHAEKDGQSVERGKDNWITTYTSFPSYQLFIPSSWKSRIVHRG